MIQRALISVSDKTGVIELGQALAAAGVEILSTGGTAALLAGAGVPVIEVADFTGFPEMLDGRVKTLHPKIHGGILGCRDRVTHQEDMRAAGIAPIDLVVVNLYPFAATVARPDCTFDDAIENIDIGGPAMVRSAAKNHADVAIVVDPADYAAIVSELSGSGSIAAATRLALAKKAFAHTAAYDGAIANWLTAQDCEGHRSAFPQRLTLQFERVLPLRYGENPHQAAAFYRDPQPAPGALAGFTQLQGKDLSYNNLMDADAAWECVKSLPAPACIIVKHANPCGVAVAKTVVEAWRRALAADPVSAFGGIIAFNAELDEATALAVAGQFCEVVIAPAVTAAARAALAGKTNVRVLEVPLAGGTNTFDFRRIGGGLLVQTPDWDDLTVADFEIVSRLTPTPEQLDDLLFAWKVARFVKSNAIVFAANGQTLGIGAGQMSRVDASRIAAGKARQMNHDLTGSVVASDAFFPFRDGVDLLAEAGAACVVHPGGGNRDAEITAAADELGLVLALTRRRHFRH